MRRSTLKIALLAATATIATATPALATYPPPAPGSQSTLVTFASDDNATTDGVGRPGGIQSVGDDANPDGSISAI